MTDETERRAKPRRRVLKSASMVTNHRNSVINCVVRNISDDGAALKLDGPVSIPEEFELRVDGKIQPAEPVWHHGLTLGVKFRPE